MEDRWDAWQAALGWRKNRRLNALNTFYQKKLNLSLSLNPRGKKWAPKFCRRFFLLCMVRQQHCTNVWPICRGGRFRQWLTDWTCARGKNKKVKKRYVEELLRVIEGAKLFDLLLQPARFLYFSPSSSICRPLPKNGGKKISSLFFFFFPQTISRSLVHPSIRCLVHSLKKKALATHDGL